MNKTVAMFLFLLFIGSALTTGCYSHPPGSEPQKPANAPAEQK